MLDDSVVADPTPGPAPQDEAVLTELEQRRQKLLDLTRRNRLLNFKPTRRTTVRVVDEAPSELFRLVALEGKTVGFLHGSPRAAPRPAPTPAPEPETPGAIPMPRKEGADPKAGFLKGQGLTEETPRLASVKSAEELGIQMANPLHRCPFCHTDVGPADVSSVCNACLSRHHGECWDELGRCASCGGNLALMSSRHARPDGEEPELPAPIDDDLTYRRVARKELPDRHRDLDLQTELGKEDLAKNLLAISRQAATTLEEQGFNPLFLALGFLEWTDRESNQAQKAPILLVPVELKRRSVRSPFRLSVGEDDPLVNPALAYKLRRDWEVTLPELPEGEEEVDPDDLFEDLAKRVAAIPGWRVTTEAAVGLFSFTKFVMYKDLETHQEHILGHRLLRRLLGDDAQAPPSSSTNLARPPAQVFSVKDADASQRAAISAVLAGDDLVLEGPPGTGKSQTITNLIAEFLARGKTVLFVSEKMAALEVVQSRLEDVGLGAFCLELHSRHTNKRAVVKNLARTLELDPPPDHAEDDTLDALGALEAKLSTFVHELHAPWGALKASPYQILGALEEDRSGFADLTSAGLLTTLTDSETWTRADLDAREHSLSALARHLDQAGPPGEHPCRGIQLEQLSYTAQGQVAETLEAALGAVEALDQAGAALAKRLRGEAPTTLVGLGARLDLAQLVLNERLPDASVLANPAWSGAPPARAQELTELNERRTALLGRLAPIWQEAIHERDDLLTWIADHEYYSQRWYRVFSPRWWSLSGSIDALRRPGYEASGVELTRDLTLAAQAQDLAAKLAAAEGEARALFGTAWPAPRERLSEVGQLAYRFRSHLREGRTSDQLLRELTAGAVERTELKELSDRVRACWSTLTATWKAFAEAAAWSDDDGLGGPVDQTPLATIRTRLLDVKGNLDQLPAWVELWRSLDAAHDVGLEAFVEKASARGIAPGRLPSVLRQAFFRRTLDQTLAEREALARFDPVTHRDAVGEFERLDTRQLQLAQIRLKHRLAAARPDAGWDAAEGSELGLLQRELRRKRGHLPVRTLLRRIPTVIRGLKPCLLMSPLTVAQYTDPSRHQYDLVIFDEASQIAPEDALGAILRGKQVVVVGDSKQMPPTSFFSAMVASDSREVDALPDLESILDECVARNLPRRVLRWHYRSRHESLITFSNRHFYEGRLRTFPSPSDGGGRLGLQHHLVADGLYERGGSGKNLPEANAVADAVLAHYQRDPTRSLGVGAFSQAQQEAILDAVEQRLRRRPDLEAILSREEEEHFFVKNLENLQGDERDVIYISIGYGPDGEGKLSMNFGPLNQSGGERRLNVLVTRAREQVVVFSSFRADQLDLRRTQSNGVALLKAYMELAEGRRLLATEDDEAPTAPVARTTVIEAISKELASEGLEVVHDLGTSGVRVDLAISEAEGDHPSAGRFVLGILVDGERYAELPAPRDRERILSSVLRHLGWQIVRVWSLEWHHHRARVLDGLRASLLEAREAVRREAEAERAQAAEAEAALDAAPPPLPEPEVRDEPIELKQPAPAADGAETHGPYEELPVEARGTEDEFPTVQLEAVAGMLQAVVTLEGPVHEDEAQRRVLAHWSLSRSGKRARVRVEEATEAALRSGTVRRKGAFLWPANLSEPPVRDRSQAGPRSLELIAPEELAAALVLVVEKEFRLAREPLIKRAAKLLGFTRAGAKMKRGIDAVLSELIAEGRLLETAGIVTPPAGGAADAAP